MPGRSDHGQHEYWTSKAMAKRQRLKAESRLPESKPIPKPRPLTPEELIDKYPGGWMCAPRVPVPPQMQALLERSARNAAKAAKRERYLKQYRNRKGGRDDAR